MSTSDEMHFDGWIKAAFAETRSSGTQGSGTEGFTALVVLVEIGPRDAKPVASTFLHVIGDDVAWAAVRKMFATAPGKWDGAAFFTATDRDGGPVPEPLARIELRRVEQMIDDDRLALNESAFFDRLGRRLRIDEDEAAE